MEIVNFGQTDDFLVDIDLEAMQISYYDAALSWKYVDILLLLERGEIT